MPMSREQKTMLDSFKAEILLRHAEGEKASSLARAFLVNEKTIKRYIERYKAEKC